MRIDKRGKGFGNEASHPLAVFLTILTAPFPTVSTESLLALHTVFFILDAALCILLAAITLPHASRGFRTHDAWGGDAYPVTSSIGYKRLRRVETHGLSSEYAGIEMFGMMHLEPCRGIDEVGKRKRMGLWKAEFGEGIKLFVDFLPNARGHPFGGHSGAKLILEF